MDLASRLGSPARLPSPQSTERLSPGLRFQGSMSANSLAEHELESIMNELDKKFVETTSTSSTPSKSTEESVKSFKALITSMTAAADDAQFNTAAREAYEKFRNVFSAVRAEIADDPSHNTAYQTSAAELLTQLLDDETATPKWINHYLESQGSCNVEAHSQHISNMNYFIQELTKLDQGEACYFSDLIKLFLHFLTKLHKKRQPLVSIANTRLLDKSSKRAVDEQITSFFQQHFPPDYTTKPKPLETISYFGDDSHLMAKEAVIKVECKKINGFISVDFETGLKPDSPLIADFLGMVQESVSDLLGSSDTAHNESIRLANLLKVIDSYIFSLARRAIKNSNIDLLKGLLQNDILKKLLSAPYPHNSLGTTLLHNAVRVKDLHAVKALLESSAKHINSFETRGEYTYTALDLAITNVDPKIVKTLIDNGAKITKALNWYKSMHDDASLLSSLHAGGQANECIRYAYLSAAKEALVNDKKDEFLAFLMGFPEILDNQIGTDNKTLLDIAQNKEKNWAIEFIEELVSPKGAEAAKAEAARAEAAKAARADAIEEARADAAEARAEAAEAKAEAAEAKAEAARAEAAKARAEAKAEYSVLFSFFSSIDRGLSEYSDSSLKGFVINGYLQKWDKSFLNDQYSLRNAITCLEKLKLEIERDMASEVHYETTDDDENESIGDTAAPAPATASETAERGRGRRSDGYLHAKQAQLVTKRLKSNIGAGTSTSQADMSKETVGKLLHQGDLFLTVIDYINYFNDLEVNNNSGKSISSDLLFVISPESISKELSEISSKTKDIPADFSTKPGLKLLQDLITLGLVETNVVEEFLRSLFNGQAPSEKLQVLNIQRTQKICENLDAELMFEFQNLREILRAQCVEEKSNENLDFLEALEQAENQDLDEERRTVLLNAIVEEYIKDDDTVSFDDELLSDDKVVKITIDPNTKRDLLSACASKSLTIDSFDPAKREVFDSMKYNVVKRIKEQKRDTLFSTILTLITPPESSPYQVSRSASPTPNVIGKQAQPDHTPVGELSRNRAVQVVHLRREENKGIRQGLAPYGGERLDKEFEDKANLANDIIRTQNRLTKITITVTVNLRVVDDSLGVTFEEDTNNKVHSVKDTSPLFYRINPGDSISYINDRPIQKGNLKEVLSFIKKEAEKNIGSPSDQLEINLTVLKPSAASSPVPAPTASSPATPVPATATPVPATATDEEPKRIPSQKVRSSYTRLLASAFSSARSQVKPHTDPSASSSAASSSRVPETPTKRPLSASERYVRAQARFGASQQRAKAEGQERDSTAHHEAEVLEAERQVARVDRARVGNLYRVKASNLRKK